MTTDNNDLNRREFLKVSGAAAVAGAVASTAREARAEAAEGYAKWPFAVAPIPMVRIGFVGVGLQGTSHVQNLVQIPGCRVTAICDIDPKRIEIATKIITGAGHRGRAAHLQKLTTVNSHTHLSRLSCRDARP